MKREIVFMFFMATLIYSCSIQTTMVPKTKPLPHDVAVPLFQETVARAIDEALKDANFSPLRGKRVYLEVVGLYTRAVDLDIYPYIESIITQGLKKSGVQLEKRPKTIPPDSPLYRILVIIDALGVEKNIEARYLFFPSWVVRKKEYSQVKVNISIVAYPLNGKGKVFKYEASGLGPLLRQRGEYISEGKIEK